MKKLQTILVPVDFTPHADNALRYAIKLAESIPQAQLQILHAYSLPSAVTNTGALALAPYYEEELIVSTQDKFLALEKRVLQDCKVPYELIGEWGPAVPDICEVAERNNVDLIVLPAHPGSPLQEYMGNVTTATIRNSHIPVLVIPPTAKFSPLTSLVFATDAQEIPNNKNLEHLHAWLRQFKPQFELLYSSKSATYYTEEEKFSRLLALRANFTPYTPQLNIVEADDPEEGIINYLELNQTSLLVVVPRKHNPLYFLLNKSVSHRLAFHTPVPMLVLL